MDAKQLTPELKERFEGMKIAHRNELTLLKLKTHYQICEKYKDAIKLIQKHSPNWIPSPPISK